ncbi:MAG: hypothetical protein ACYC99_11335 [Candidatus Geothermincolia bacterium]
MRDWGWRRITPFALLVVIAVGAVAGGLLWWMAASHRKSVDKFKSKTASEWTTVAAKMSLVTASLAHVASPADLDGVARDSVAMQEAVTNAAAGLKKKGAPSGYGTVAEKEAQALESLSRYLEMLYTLSSTGDVNEVVSSRALLEDRARQAQDKVTGFLTAAPWLRVKLPGDFYQAGQALQTAFQPVDPAVEAERQAVYDTLKTFMDADIFKQNLDQIWSMLANRLHEGFALFDVTKDKLMAGWTKAWGDKRPVNYYVSKAQIAFQSPGDATARAIAYVENGDPRIEEIRLVKEGGVWKIDSYPFVGWL